MKNALFSALTGVLLALAWPTYGFPLLLFFGFVPLLLVEFDLRQKKVKRLGLKVFGLAYLGFFIWNLITTYWIYYSTPEGAAFALIVNTLLMSLVFLIYHHTARRINFTAAGVFLASLWMGFEYLHLHWDFSWPWLNLGNGFSEYIKWIQWYEYTGTFGGTLWVWIVNLSIFRFILLYKQHQDITIIYRGLLRVFLLIGIPIGISYILWVAYPKPETQAEIEALILQPNIDPYNEKYNTNDERIGELLLKMTDENISPSTDIVLAPETVFADGTDRNNFESSFAYLYGNEIIQRYPNTTFLSGVSFYELIRDKDSIKPQTNFLRPGLWFNDYNSAFFMAGGNPAQFYNKSKLVVGVETFPYQSVLQPLLGDIMIDLGGTVAMKTTQDERSVFNLHSEDATAPIICYESVYGEYVNQYVKNGARFLSIITNDAWWEDTQGHKQHLSLARLRAIETRRDIARSANTGISAIINQRGEVLEQTNYGDRDAILGAIHLNDTKTFYMKHGDYIARVSLLMAFFTFLLAFFRKRKTRIPLK